MDTRVIIKNPPPNSVSRKGSGGSLLNRLDVLTMLVALVLGTMVWFVVDMKRMEEVTIPVDLELERNLPADWKLMNKLASSVQVVMRGSRQALNELNKDNLRIDLNLPEGALVGDVYDGTLTLLPEQVRGKPASVEIKAINPTVIPVSLAKLMTKYVTVEPGEITGTPAQGYTVGQVHQPDPPAMPVVAPKSFLDRIGPGDTIRTKPISIEGGQGMQGAVVELLPFEKDDITVPVPGRVYVAVELPEIPAKRELEEALEVRALVSAPFDMFTDLRLTPQSVKVTVSGPQAVVDKLTANDVTVYVDLRDRVSAAAGEFNVKCKALAPPRVHVTRIEPDTVKWIVKETPKTQP